MRIDEFHISLFNLLESIIYIYEDKTKEIIFINKNAKKVLEIDDIKDIKIPRNILIKFLGDYSLEENALITDNEYIEYYNKKYLVTRNLSIYKGKKVVLCICNDVTKSYNNYNNLKNKNLQKSDILIESIRLLGKDEDLFDSIYKVIKMIGEFYSAKKAYIYELITRTRGCSYEWESEKESKGYSSSEIINSEIENWGRISEDKSILFIEDIETLKEKWEEKYLELKAKNVSNLVVVVMKFLEKPSGVLCLEDIGENKDFSLLNSLIHFILNEMKRRKISKKLNFMSYHDIATGLNNRNKYIWYLENANYNSIKTVGVAFLDINGLKQINDTIGHEFGDRAIAEVASTLKKFFRAVDIYRIGGDEFVIICENIKKENFYRKVNDINKYFIDLGEYSVSIGYIWKDNNINISELAKKADEFMYKAKRNYYSTISTKEINVYSSMVTEAEDDKNRISATIGHDNVLDFENQNISYKTKQEIFQYKIKQMLDNPNYKNLIMVMLDINNFKAINEMYGFDAGNKILLSINAIINSNIFGKGICYHMHSDIYYFCMESSSDEETAKIINKINKEINKNNSNTKISISYGVYKIENKNISVEEICERVNYAHKVSKKENVNKFVFYDKKIREEMINEKQIENDMERGIINNEFKLYLQPKYNIYTETIEGAEALVRWEHVTKGLMFPNKFISIFEKNGFIVNLDLYMLEQVCKFIRKNIDNGRRNVPISVNMSKLNFKKSNFKDKIMKIINKYGIDPSFIELEITESLMIEEQEKVINIINELKKENLKISIDDFGTGYSSLSVLQKLSIDILKIDCGFFKNFGEIKKGKAIIKMIVKLAKEIELKVVAEGIEKIEEVEFLKSIGCDTIQGYYFSKPISIEEFECKMYNIQN